MKELDELTKTFKEGKYDFEVDGLQIDITRNSKSYLIFYILLAFITIPLVFADYRIFLLAVLAIGIPIIYRRWKQLPNQVVVYSLAKTLCIEKNGQFQPDIPFSEIQTFSLDEEILNSDANPFKSGNQDFIYTFKLTTINGRIHELIRLEFQESKKQSVEKIYQFLMTALDLRSNTKTNGNKM